MKKTTFLTILFLSIFLQPAISKAENKVDITFKFKAINTREGFDLTSKLIVYCDDVKVGESTSKLQSKQNSVTVKIPTGNHNVRAVLNALNDAGNWEERTIANEYSIDFVYDKTDYWSSSRTINLTYDITKEVVNVDENKDANVVSATSTSTKTNDYNAELQKINTYLKTFDNGYYGYLEIKDGFLYDRFPSGKYSKSEIKLLGTPFEEEKNRKVSIKCKNESECVFSTYTDSYHNLIGFSQSTDFNTDELITMFNNLLDAYNGSSNSISSIKTNNTSTNNSTALQKLNDYLKTFDNGYYGYLEIKDGYLYDRFKSGKYSKSEIKFLGSAYEEEKNRKVSIKCNNDNDCVFSTYTDSYHKSIGFSQSTDFNTKELITLLDNVIQEYKGNKPTTNIKTSANTSSNGNYQTVLKKLNDYLKTFDNGYYGYFEVINNEIFIRLKAGTYCSALISDLDKAYIVDDNKKIELRCLGGKNCMNATYTTGKITGLKMYQDKNFDTEEFIQLINDLISTLKNSKTNTPNSGNETEAIKTSTNNSNNSSTNYSTKSTTNNNSTGNYQTAIQKLNDYLKTFDNGYYGYFEVKDGYIYDRFKAGKYNKFKMEDMEGAVIQEQYNRVIFKCKGDSKCISTDWRENGKEDYSQFTKGSAFNYQELADLLNNFRDAYLGKKQTSTNNSTVSTNKTREQIAKERNQKSVKTNKNNDDDLDEDWDALEATASKLQKSVKEAEKVNSTNKNYSEPLKKLNEYLKTYNAETYRDIEVKDGKVYFAFFVYGAKYNSSIDISELKNNTIITIGKSVGSSVVDEVKISCKGSNKYFYSTYSKGNADHFRFFSYSVKDFTKMEQLVIDFVKAL